MHTRTFERIQRLAEAKESEKMGGKSDYTDKDIEAALLKFIIMERLPLSKLNSKYLKTLMKGSSIIIYFLCRSNRGYLTLKIGQFKV